MSTKKLGSLVLSAAVAGMLLSAPRSADAMCGCMMGPMPPVKAGPVATSTPIYNDASMVVLMRDGTRTVISMSNNYKGPATDFALVVPVPVVLSQDNVKTLPADTFHRIEKLTAPKLVEYWEQDPCPTPMMLPSGLGGGTAMKGAGEGMAKPMSVAEAKEPVVKVEAKFAVGEYDIVILGAKESDGLESWLKTNGYNVPNGASAALAPYIKEQQKFFVAKVNIKKVQMDAQGVAVLSPLRFSYESTDFRLPVRLGLLNAKDKQDLIVFTLSRSVRYEVANYPNVFIPTNIEVTADTKEKFGATYAALFDEAVAKGKGKGIVTEYSWAAPPIAGGDVTLLGGDVIFGTKPAVPMVLTRLHARYDNTTLTDDLVFSVAEAVSGGRELNGTSPIGPKGEVEKGAQPASQNHFQARYLIRHAWKGPIKCAAPQKGIWGGPPGAGPPVPTPALNLGAQKRGGVELVKQLKAGLPDFQIKAASMIVPVMATIEPPSATPDAGTIDDAATPPPPAPADASFGAPPASSTTVPPVQPGTRGCGCELPGRGALGENGTDLAMLGLAGSIAAIGRVFRRRRRGS
jgi:hypothetical protein